MSMVNCVIRNGDNAKLAVIYVGRGTDSISYDDCLRYLSILTSVSTDDLRIKYRLCKGLKSEETQQAITSGGLQAGHYTIVPLSTDTPELVPSTSTERLFPPSAPSTRASRSSSKIDINQELSQDFPFMKIDAPEEKEVTDDEELSPEEVQQYALFSLSLGLRDRRCVASGVANPNKLVGAYVIPHSWKARRYEGLPLDIRNQLTFEYAEMGVDDVRNGMLLESAIHNDFHHQYWSVVEDEPDRWRIVAITKEAPKNIVGKFLLLPDPGEAEDGELYQNMFVFPEFLRFHLKTAVLRRMRGDGEGDDTYDKPIYDAIKIWADDARFTQYVASGGHISSAVE
ncbi:hypothetical protein BC832DRAFT_9107 [Gaertneriomyces semiglobifer]|nr:hypothetical protein BC832DRAFT_9107 [Gaertneriomyces semiglobifer]